MKLEVKQQPTWQLAKVNNCRCTQKPCPNNKIMGKYIWIRNHAPELSNCIDLEGATATLNTYNTNVLDTRDAVRFCGMPVDMLELLHVFEDKISALTVTQWLTMTNDQIYDSGKCSAQSVS